jgi:uncharacterized protein
VHYTVYLGYVAEAGLDEVFTRQNQSPAVDAVDTATMAEAIDSAQRGLDGRGFIRSEVSLAQVRPSYRPVIDSLRDACRSAFADQLHSLYLTGSVVKGTARPGESDLDALAVLHVAPEPAHQAAARGAAHGLEQQFRFLSDVSLLLFAWDTILSEAERDDLGFFVKCLCACIDGEDLGKRLPKYRPSVALARGTNGNIRQLLTDRRQHLIDSTDPAEVAAICRGILRKIVRTGFTLVMPRYHGWTSDLEQAATIFAVYYPIEAAAMNEALALALAPSTKKAPVLAVIDALGGWLAAEYDRVILGTE